MNIPHQSRALTGAFFLLLGSSLSAAEPATITDALAQGKVSINLRARYESVDQSGLKDGDALTLRTRLGYTTAAFSGLKASVEFENIASPEGDRYSQAGINPGGAGRAVVADPVGTEVNQAWLSFTADKTAATLGRQRFVLDNARFVGDVAWRQNMQTYDALVLQDKSLDKLTLSYAYLYRINRVFGDKHPQGNWDSDSHLFNASYSGFKPGTIAAYAYLLDFDNAAAQSCATYGLSFTGTDPLTKDLKITYRAEYATQSDYGSSPLNYTAEYSAFEGGLAAKPGGLALGYEVLGSDGGVSFRTPLATLHAFNGWADLFLTTPGNGLRDTYVKAVVNLPEGFNFLGFHHWFKADRLGADYGNEWDLQLSRKFGKAITATLKYADFHRETLAFANVKKFWLQAEFVY